MSRRVTRVAYDPRPMDPEEAWAVLDGTTTFGGQAARRLAAMAVLESDPSPDTIEHLIDSVDGAARRQASALPEAVRAGWFRQLMVADVVISGVLRHHPRADIEPVVARRLAALRVSRAFAERDPFAIWMAEALSFVLARRALDAHRETIEALWLHELEESGRALVEKWGDDALKAKLAPAVPEPN